MAMTEISAEEFESRHERIREFLKGEGLGAMFVYSPPAEHKWGQTAHVGYLSGWANHDRIIDSAVVVPAEGPAALLYAGLPFMGEQIADVSPLTDVRLARAVDPNAVAVARSKDGSGGPRDFVGETLAILDENNLAGKSVAVVGIENMPAPFFEAIQAGFGDQFRRTRDFVAEIRGVKSEGEAALMKESARLSDLGFETMLKTARPGMKGIEIVAEMERAVRRQGADHAKYWMLSGPPTRWEDTRLDIKPHLRVLQEGDLMASCSYVVYQGYWCHGQRTGTLGAESKHLNEIFKIARDAQDEGLNKMKAGARIADVAAAIRKTGEAQGFPLMGGRIGHGIGMDYSEQPVPLTESNDAAFESGMTCVIHAAYALPESGKMFVPLGDVCRITNSGPEFLMNFTRDPFLAGT
jgi:Xaa-Pro dipeptidase